MPRPGLILCVGVLSIVVGGCRRVEPDGPRPGPDGRPAPRDGKPEPGKGGDVSPDDEYHNPIDKKTYVAQGGWKTYQPEVPRPDDPGKKVKSKQLRLLTSQDDIAVRTTVEALVDFVKEAERLAEECLGKSEKQFKLLVEFKCTPDGHEVSLAHQGDAPQELLQKYHDALSAAKKLPVRSGEVSFQMEMSVSP